MNGFTYRGIHCSVYGCLYVPDNPESYVETEDYSVIDAEMTDMDGGQYFGAYAKPRPFSLKCFFDNISIQTFNNMIDWLRKDKNGRQIFDSRPNVYYDVFPTKKVSPKIYRIGDTQSGTFTIEFTAYFPYGKMTLKSYDVTDNDNDRYYSGIIATSKMPSAPLVSSTDFFVYNCGTEPCNMIIRIAGDVDATSGMLLTNAANGSTCKIIDLTDESLPVDSYLEIDGELGKVFYEYSNEDIMAYEFHDQGYIVLEPCGMLHQDIEVSYTNGSTNVTNADGVFLDSMKGQYIYLENTWKYISSVTNANTIVVNTPMGSDGTETTDIVTLNYITVAGTNTLTTFEIDYTPIVR